MINIELVPIKPFSNKEMSLKTFKGYGIQFGGNIIKLFLNSKSYKYDLYLPKKFWDYLFTLNDDLQYILSRIIESIPFATQ